MDFDPFAAAGVLPTQPAAPDAGYSTVIDVGGPSNIDPSAQAGEPGSGLVRSQVGGAPTANPAPPPVVPGSVSDTVNTMLEDTAPGKSARAATASPPATAASATETGKASEKFDPFAAAGFPTTPAAAATAPPAAPAAAGAASPILQPIKDAIHSVVQSLSTVPPEGSGPLGTPPAQGATSSLQHGFTLGLDEILAPLIPAAAESAATGKPFSQVYNDVVQQMRDPRADFEKQHPYAAAALSTAGAAASPNVFGKLFAGAPAASTAGRVVNGVRNVAAGTAVGAGTGFTMADGDINQRLEGAKQGAEAGGVLSAVAPLLVGGAQKVYRFARPGLAVEPTAAKIIRETAGIGPNEQLPVPQGGPLPAPSGHPGFGPSTGEAFDNPGLAAEQYRQFQADPNALAQRRAGWSQAIQEGATTPQAAQRGARLASALIRPPEASEAAAHAFQSADNVLRTEQSRLWNTPALTNVQPNLNHLSISIDRGVGSLSQSLQRDVRGSRLQGFIDDIKALEPGASLHDVNAFRSDILTFAKGARRSDPALAMAADKIAKVVLDSIESNPALRTNPAAWADYVRARKFTAAMHDVMDQPQFQKMLAAVKSGTGLGNVAEGLFNTAQGFEVTPQGIRKIQGLLDDVRRTWGAMRTAAGGTPAVYSFRGTPVTLSPSTAFGARVDLGQTTRDFLISKMLDRSVAVGAGVGDVDLQRLNDVHQFLRKNYDSMARSGLFTRPQMEIADALNRAAIMGQRVMNQQAPGSPTYKLFQGKNYIQGILGGSVSPVWGPLVGMGLAGALTHTFGETGLGVFLGAEAGGAVAGHLGQTLLAGRLGPVREEILAKVKEAMDNPQVAYDLTRPVGAKISDATKQWLRALLAVVPASEVGRTMPPSSETVH